MHPERNEGRKEDFIHNYSKFEDLKISKIFNFTNKKNSIRPIFLHKFLFFEKTSFENFNISENSRIN
jgi:hypothetical protein